MYALQLLLCLASVFLMMMRVTAEDDERKGPMMKVNPDGTLFTTAQSIDDRGFKSETHKVTTEDGYTLTIFRILPQLPDANKPPVLFQHGFLCSSDCWICDSESIVFKLASEGYDVWIANSRGNAYCLEHNKWTSKEPKFWDFSWIEMSAKDLPTTVDYILKTTNHKALHVVGHSFGASLAAHLVSTVSEYNAKILLMVLWAPAVFMGKMKMLVGADGMMEAMATNIMDGFKEGGKPEFFCRKDLDVNNNSITCQDMKPEGLIPMCDGKVMEMETILGGPYIPAGTSTKNLIHMHQIGRIGELASYDMGSKEENQKIYGSDDPPLLSDALSTITAPVAIWYAEEDQIITPDDIDKLAKMFKQETLVAKIGIKEECFDHMAFLVPLKKSCLPVRDKMYQEMMELMKKTEMK